MCGKANPIPLCLFPSACSVPGCPRSWPRGIRLLVDRLHHGSRQQQAVERFVRQLPLTDREALRCSPSRSRIVSQGNAMIDIASLVADRPDQTEPCILTSPSLCSVLGRGPSGSGHSDSREGRQGHPSSLQWRGPLISRTSLTASLPCSNLIFPFPLISSEELLERPEQGGRQPSHPRRHIGQQDHLSGPSAHQPACSNRQRGE